jgi:hypothetical protein
MKLPLFIVQLIITLNISLCWWDTGHMLVAKIAELTLKGEGIIYLHFK